MAEKCKITCLPWSEVQHHHLNGKKRKCTGPQFNIKILSYQYRKSHCGHKTVVRSSYLHNVISYTGKMISLYWIRAQIFIDSQTWPITEKPCPIPHGHFSLEILEGHLHLKQSFFSLEILKCCIPLKYSNIIFFSNTWKSCSLEIPSWMFRGYFLLKCSQQTPIFHSHVWDGLFFMATDSYISKQQLKN